MPRRSVRAPRGRRCGCTRASTGSPTTASAASASLTNKTPVGAYRGAGRPEATYAIERIVDDLAAEIGIDPVELRRQNWIDADAFPYKTARWHRRTTSGDYAATTDAMLELADYAGLRKRQAGA